MNQLKDYKTDEEIEKIGKQYENIFQLANQLDMTIDEILDENLRKVNSRYNEKGEATR